MINESLGDCWPNWQGRGHIRKKQEKDGDSQKIREGNKRKRSWEEGQPEESSIEGGKALKDVVDNREKKHNVEHEDEQPKRGERRELEQYFFW